MEVNNNLGYALDYARKGLHVFPCHSIRNGKCSCGVEKCSNQGKHPRTINGFKDATTDEYKIIRYWEENPDANIGCATGEISGIVVLDIDVKHNRSLKEFKIPPTPVVKTGGGGDHVFFKYPGSHIKSTNGQVFGNGVDVKADGGYVILAPSLHLSGNHYEWIIPFEDMEELAEMPEWFLNAVNINQKEKKWLEGKDGVSEGSRNETAASMAGKLLSSTPYELWENIGWENFKIWNQKCLPPLGERELRNTWDSIKRSHITTRSNKSFKKNKKGKAITKCLADIKSVPISWLWEGRIALGKLTMIAGDPGLGKSLVTANLAASVSKGFPWPVGGSNAPIGDVILLSAEDDPADTTKPRLEAMEADCSRIHIIEAIQDEITEEEKPKQHMFSFKRDIEVLSNLLLELPNCRLVIIDPVSAYLDSTDGNSNSDIRGLLAPLAEIASKHKVAIVLVSHLNKNSGGNSSYRVMGSLAFTAAVRAAYIVTKDQNNPERRLVMPLKNNLAKDNTGLAYTILEINGAPTIAWEDKPVEMTLDEALDSIETNELTATDEAIEFLKYLLLAGPVRADEAQKEARQAGIKEKALRSAREKMGLKIRKIGFNPGYWIWGLNEDAQIAEDAQSKIDGTFDNEGHLRGEKMEEIWKEKNDPSSDFLKPIGTKDIFS